MAGPDPKQDEWFDEFRKLNTGPKSGSSPPPDASPSDKADPAAPPAAKGGERRRHSRFEIDQVSAHLAKEGLLAFIGVGKGNLARAAIDLSEGGAQFMVHERLAPGTKVRVKISVEKFKDTIEAAGVVRWCFQSAKSKEQFYAGVQFVGIDGVQSRKIASLRDWFTSPQFKALRQSRGRPREKGPEITTSN